MVSTWLIPSPRTRRPAIRAGSRARVNLASASNCSGDINPLNHHIAEPLLGQGSKVRLDLLGLRPTSVLVLHVAPGLPSSSVRIAAPTWSPAPGTRESASAALQPCSVAWFAAPKEGKTRMIAVAKTNGCPGYTGQLPVSCWTMRAPCSIFAPWECTGQSGRRKMTGHIAIEGIGPVRLANHMTIGNNPPRLNVTADHVSAHGSESSIGNDMALYGWPPNWGL